MKKIFLLAAFAAMALQISAQETYENATLTDQDLNGTARYIGMGGAMEALGADISTATTNPAGLGLLRKGQVSLTAGLHATDGQEAVLDGSKSRMSFDQIGFVYTIPTSTLSHITMGFNYNKSKNYHQLLSVGGDLGGKASQNKLSCIKYMYGYCDDDLDTFNQLDYLYKTEGFFGVEIENLDGKKVKVPFVQIIPAERYLLQRSIKGGVSQYSASFAYNLDTRFYFGLTLGISSVNYNAESLYGENLVGGKSLSVYDRREVSGEGWDVKLGTIIRPIADSPFRFGLYLNTPTMYSLCTSNYTTLTHDLGKGNARSSSSETYEFALFTPWKFGVSLGHTIGNYLALGATYEFADYNSLDSRIIDGSYYDYYGGYSENSHSDKNMNRNTRDALRRVSTIKLGAEVKPVDNIAIRLGYNYISPKYSMDGFKDGTVDSPGSFYASMTDYTNWKETHRFTAGLGWNVSKNVAIDVAYQYTQTKGEFAPFASFYIDEKDVKLENIANIEDVSNNRHHIAASLTWKF